jgi:hypothetical protein
MDDKDLFHRVRKALEQSWSLQTCVIYNSSYPSYGQCAQTSIVVWERFGGDILKTTGWHGTGVHFYNHIEGKRYDFTADQFFAIPDYKYNLTYEDQRSSKQEAMQETDNGQVYALRQAFLQAFDGLEQTL